MESFLAQPSLGNTHNQTRSAATIFLLRRNSLVLLAPESLQVLHAKQDSAPTPALLSFVFLVVLPLAQLSGQFPRSRVPAAVCRLASGVSPVSGQVRPVGQEVFRSLGVSELLALQSFSIAFLQLKSSSQAVLSCLVSSAGGRVLYAEETGHCRVSLATHLRLQEFTQPFSRWLARCTASSTSCGTLLLFLSVCSSHSATTCS
jgi:hypothetical protein